MAFCVQETYITFGIGSGKGSGNSINRVNLVIDMGFDARVVFDQVQGFGIEVHRITP
jgi:hypothetical protein